MRWFRRKRESVTEVPADDDGMTPGPFSAYWWRPGCTCHWSAGIDADYCDFCKASNRSERGDA